MELTLIQKIKTMPTDPARVRRTDPGEPTKCPVWQLHEVYSDEPTKEWVLQGCRTAGIGCIECKQPVIDGVLEELKPIKSSAMRMNSQPTANVFASTRGSNNRPSSPESIRTGRNDSAMTAVESRTGLATSARLPTSVCRRSIASARAVAGIN